MRPTSSTPRNRSNSNAEDEVFVVEYASKVSVAASPKPSRSNSDAGVITLVFLFFFSLSNFLPLLFPCREEQISKDEADYVGMLDNLRAVYSSIQQNPQNVEEEEIASVVTSKGEVEEEEFKVEYANKEQEDKSLPFILSTPPKVLVSAERDATQLPSISQPSIPIPSTSEVATSSKMQQSVSISTTTAVSGDVTDSPKFTLLGQTLQLPNVSTEDSLFYRIESLRIYLENELGMDTFIKTYNLVKGLQEQDDEESFNEKLRSLLETKLNILPLINQLIFCEEAFQSDDHIL